MGALGMVYIAIFAVGLMIGIVITVYAIYQEKKEKEDINLLAKEARELERGFDD